MKKLKTRWLGLALLLLASIAVFSLKPQHASAAIAFDKDLGANTVGSDTGPGNTVSFTTSQAAASNSKIIVVTSMFHQAACILSSISGGSLTWHVDKTSDLGNNAESIGIASADAASGLASSTVITATFQTTSGGGTNCSPSPGSRYISGSSYTGVATGTTFDGTASSVTVTANVWNGGTINTANANDLIFGFGQGEIPAGFTGCTPSTNYTDARSSCDREIPSDANAWEPVYRIVSSTNSYTTGGTFNGGSTATGQGASVAYKSGNSVPAAPTLNSPASGAAGIPVQPVFNLRTTDAEGDYLQYEIQVCSTSNCSSVVRTVCQFTDATTGCTGSQTGWSGQDQQTSTAYTGSSLITSSTMAVHTYQPSALTANTQYWWRAYAKDPGGSATVSAVSSISSFTTSQAPAAPTLIDPPASATGVPSLPIFQLRTSDADNDYLDYEIQICTTSNCSSVLVTYCQVSSLPNSCTGSQTNWQGQDANSAAAYLGSSTLANSTIARYQYSGTALTLGTQYWWRAYAIDPGGSQTASSASSIGTFTIGASEVKIQGGVNINGGTIIQ